MRNCPSRLTNVRLKSDCSNSPVQFGGPSIVAGTRPGVYRLNTAHFRNTAPIRRVSRRPCVIVAPARQGVRDRRQIRFALDNRQADGDTSAHIMHLNGWRRLWVVLTVMWTLVVGVVTWNAWPSAPAHVLSIFPS